MSNGEIIHEDPSVSVDTDGNDRVRIRVWTDVLTGESTVIVLDLAEALELTRSLTNAIVGSVRGAVLNLRVGDCPTCKNTRLVDEMKNGRVMRVRCPTCGPAFEAAQSDPYARPRIGGGTR